MDISVWLTEESGNSRNSPLTIHLPSIFYTKYMATTELQTNGTEESKAQNSVIATKEKAKVPRKERDYSSGLVGVADMKNIRIQVIPEKADENEKKTPWAVRLKYKNKLPLIGLNFPLNLPFGLQQPKAGCKANAPMRLAIRLQDSEADEFDKLYIRIYNTLQSEGFTFSDAQSKEYLAINRGKEENYPPLINASVFGNIQRGGENLWAAALRLSVTIKETGMFYLNATLMYLATDEEVEVGIPLYLEVEENNEYDYEEHYTEMPPEAEPMHKKSKITP